MNDEAVYRTAPATPGLLIIALQLQSALLQCGAVVECSCIVQLSAIWEISPRAENDPIKLGFFVSRQIFFAVLLLWKLLNTFCIT